MRILLKLSGEVLSGEGKKGYSPDTSFYAAQEIKALVKKGHEVGVVIGAGNLVRGKELKDISRTMADQMGMLATVMNAIYLKEILEKYGVPSVVFSNIVNLPSVHTFNYDEIDKLLKDKVVVIFAGGTSNPLFTTDSAAALRAAEIKADVILKATKVDGVYDKDPKLYKDARKYEKISFEEAIKLDLKVMDIEAFSICKKVGIEIIVYNFFEKGASVKAVEGKTGTKVIP